MNCKQIGDQLLDLAAGTMPDAEAARHLETCDACADKLAGLVQTMSVMDEWQAPEPSLYFNSRLRARLREEAVRPMHSWLDWLRKPALAMGMAALMTVGITLYEHDVNSDSAQQTASATQSGVMVQPGTAVSDLQNLDKNHDLFANFDLLDDLIGQDTQQVANP